eukprot:2771021-Pleurochrysis_carterae.AAC.1
MHRHARALTDSDTTATTTATATTATSPTTAPIRRLRGPQPVARHSHRCNGHRTREHVLLGAAQVRRGEGGRLAHRRRRCERKRRVAPRRQQLRRPLVHAISEHRPAASGDTTDTTDTSDIATTAAAL